MALSMDDKLLGEKVHYYCSSSEDEGDDEDSGKEDENPQSAGSDPRMQPPPLAAENNGIVTNTGPKGVIKDWREFKRLETEKRAEQELEKIELSKKLTLTCRSYLNDEQEKEEDEKFLAQLEEIEDDFIKEYRLRRLEEMRDALASIPKFGKLISVDSNSFIKEVDEEAYGVTVIVHIYEPHVEACEAMNGCLMCLASEYPTVKFCKLSASDAKMSINFAERGVPALLIYKNKDLIGNFVGLRDEFGDDFFANDIESFLQEHAYLPHKDSIRIIRDSTTGDTTGPLQQEEDSGSDFDVD